MGAATGIPCPRMGSSLGFVLEFRDASTPGFRGARVQVGKCSALFRAEWRRVRREKLPSFSSHLLGVAHPPAFGYARGRRNSMDGKAHHKCRNDQGIRRNKDVHSLPFS